VVVSVIRAVVVFPFDGRRVVISGWRCGGVEVPTLAVDALIQSILTIDD
jgi:hypothetical protein